MRKILRPLYLILLTVAVPVLAQQQPPGVIVSEALIQPFPLSSEALGNARANEAVDIRPQITAAITAILFEEGSSVEKGEVLLRLESSEPLADLAAGCVALTAEEMARMINGLIKGCGAKGEKDAVIISLGEKEKERIRKALLAELGGAVSKGITLQSSSDVRGGFLISFDKGKSSYDFTDRAIAEYLGSVLKPELGEILKEAVPEEPR